MGRRPALTRLPSFPRLLSQAATRRSSAARLTVFDPSLGTIRPGGETARRRELVEQLGEARRVSCARDRRRCRCNAGRAHPGARASLITGQASIDRERDRLERLHRLHREHSRVGVRWRRGQGDHEEVKGAKLAHAVLSLLRLDDHVAKAERNRVVSHRAPLSE
jgi:hypothetical protein